MIYLDNAATTMKKPQCVIDAVVNAIKCTTENGVCLFSPAAASYNYYKNFEEKGRHFKELVVKYG